MGTFGAGSILTTIILYLPAKKKSAVQNEAAKNAKPGKLPPRREKRPENSSVFGWGVLYCYRVNCKKGNENGVFEDLILRYH